MRCYACADRHTQAMRPQPALDRDGPVAMRVGAAAYLVWTWAVVSRMDEQRIASHATREDPTRVATEVIVLAGECGPSYTR
jgi:hypothetical protein